ncbi:hypothetical protein H4Q26_001606 [Puccinia striiformis f. sp. tritici PST-130]|nr:hypothetical protein H4Q26_001606 [Puccinia striiformis f. sp. tritici PST-130]
MSDPEDTREIEHQGSNGSATSRISHKRFASLAQFNFSGWMILQQSSLSSM